MPEMQGNTVIYPLSPRYFADSMTKYIEEKALSVVGGCCGTTPEHLELLVNSVHGHPAPHKAFKQKGSLSSPLHARSIQQTPPPFIIGERLNTQGSKNFKNIILAEDFTQAEALAAKQVESGAHGLDLCTALTENDLEEQNLVTLIRRISHTQDAPLIIDTTNPKVMEAALQATPGRCLLNSTNFESGNEKARKVFGLAKTYGAAVLVLTIDETGMAKTLDQKLAIVERAYHMAVDEMHLSPRSLVFDPLTFSLAS
jgi:5-methyltetrahydrofolate--homocysteine methyltransferase